MHALVSHVIYYSTYIPKFPVSYITTHTHLSSPCHVLQYIHTKFHVTYIAGHAHLSSSCHLSSSYYNTYTPRFFLDFFCCQHKFHRRRPASCAERESKYLNVDSAECTAWSKSVLTSSSLSVCLVMKDLKGNIGIWGSDF